MIRVDLGRNHTNQDSPRLVTTSLHPFIWFYHSQTDSNPLRTNDGNRKTLRLPPGPSIALKAQ